MVAVAALTRGGPVTGSDSLSFCSPWTAVCSLGTTLVQWWLVAQSHHGAHTHAQQGPYFLPGHSHIFLVAMLSGGRTPLLRCSHTAGHTVSSSLPWGWGITDGRAARFTVGPSHTPSNTQGVWPHTCKTGLNGRQCLFLGLEKRRKGNTGGKRYWYFKDTTVWVLYINED